MRLRVLVILVGIASAGFATANEDRAYLDACIAAAGGQTATARNTCFGQVSELCLATKGGATEDMVVCAERELLAWEELLEVGYEAIRSAGDEARIAYIDDSQKVWTDWRQARCGVYATFEGSVYRPLAVLCLAETTARRVVDFWAIERGFVGESAH